ncbi:MAG: YaiO family outer membrane protein [Rhodothermales bacterium]|jgi:YaiO family outer membrane protein
MRLRWSLLLLLGCSVTQSSAQDVYVQSGSQATTFDCDTGAWTQSGAGIGLDGERSDVYFEASRSSRCGGAETRLLADVYQRFGKGMYANVRIVLTPNADRHPRSDVLAEAFRAIGKRLEASLQVRQMRYPGTTATIVAPSLTRYAGNRYVRLQVLGAKAGEAPLSIAATASFRTYREGRNYVEFRTGAGREVIELPGALLVSLGYYAGLSANQRIGRFRLAPNVGWTYDQQLGGRGTIGLQVRTATGDGQE